MTGREFRILREKFNYSAQEVADYITENDVKRGKQFVYDLENARDERGQSATVPDRWVKLFCKLLGIQYESTFYCIYSATSDGKQLVTFHLSQKECLKAERKVKRDKKVIAYKVTDLSFDKLYSYDYDLRPDSRNEPDRELGTDTGNTTN